MISCLDKLAGAALLLAACTVASGCSSQMLKHDRTETEVQRPEEISNFATLYRQNCSACHGADGQHGAAIDLANPVYQAVVDDASLRRIVVNGEPGTLMPAFGHAAGGMLTDVQVEDLVHGMRESWQKSGTLDGQNAPPYTPDKTGDAGRGQKVYGTYCAPCHGTGTQRGPKASAILDPSFLALMGDPALRSSIIAGRPDLGMPDWRHKVDDAGDPKEASKPMSDQDVTDVVTWLGTHRIKTPGQPYP